MPGEANDPSPIADESSIAENDAAKSLPLPTPLQIALEKVPDKDARATLQVALSKTTFGFGPDPETAKILISAEMHEEDCRLKGFQASLENKEKQGVRDHDFRNKKLNHQSIMAGVVLLVTVGGVGCGLALIISGNTALGNPVLVASFTMSSGLAGKLLASRD